MTPRIKLLIACVQLLTCHLVAYKLVEGGHDVFGAIVFLGSWGLFMWLGFLATWFRIMKPRKAKAAPVSESSDPAPEAS